jgi:hypothetical protein
MTGGGVPSELSEPRPLPGSRGVLGKRAAWPLSGGAMQASVSALWYYAVSQGFKGLIESGSLVEEELTREVRNSWSTLQTAGGSASCVCMFREQLWAFGGVRYMRRTRNGHWEQGSFSASVKAAIPSETNGLIVAGTDGKMRKIKDAGGTGSWSYSTGILEAPRTIIKHFECHYTGRPRVALEAWDGNGRTAEHAFDLADGKVSHYPSSALALLQGWRFRATFSGTQDDTVESFDLMFDALPGGKNN